MIFKSIIVFMYLDSILRSVSRRYIVGKMKRGRRRRKKDRQRMADHFKIQYNALKKTDLSLKFDIYAVAIPHVVEKIQQIRHM